VSNLDNLIENNLNWAGRQTSKDRHYFENLSHGQSPKVLWFGCSDSRIPVSKITDSGPGEILVYRNIANQVDVNDHNTMALIEYAIDHLKIADIVVCGHTGCYGIKAACDDLDLGNKSYSNEHLDQCISDIRNIANSEKADQQQLSAEQLTDSVAKQNVLAQVAKLKSLAVVKNAKNVSIHAWLFELESGKLLDLDSQ